MPGRKDWCTMLITLFYLMMIVVFGKLAWFGLKAAWGIFTFVGTILFLPLILIVLVIAGLLELAWPILLIIGIIALFKKPAV